MTKEELKQKAENFIINRYKLNECFREDNVETREYMRIDVHSQYEDEYQLYLDAIKELQKETVDQLTYAKTIIQDLLDNTDEYARQRAIDFLKENK